tara:strand:+ start:5743 stop:6321 length:579 start_codon:yes stop_codon:yes gene_type:complete
MKLSMASNTKTTIEAGLYPAVCYGLIDIGTQENEYQGKVNYQRKAILKFELLDEFSEDDKRIVLSQIYNMSLNEMSKFRKHLKGWRGRDFTDEELSNFEPKKVLGSNVILNVTINDKGRAIIDSMARYKDDTQESQREQEYFTLDGFNETLLPDYISEGIANIIHRSKEWKALEQGGNVEKISHAEKEEIPF